MREALELSYLAIAPEAVLALGAIVVLLVDVIWKPRLRLHAWIVADTLVIATVFAVWQWLRVTDLGPVDAFGRMVALDHFAVFGRFVLIGIAALGLAAGWSLMDRLNRRAAEAISLVLLAAAGFSFMAASTHLVMTFLALEVGSISLYILAGFTRETAKAREAAVKYFLLGSFASAIFIYGAALVYAGTGQLSYQEIGAYLRGTIVFQPAVLLIGLALLIVGLGFKVSLAPFHTWAPDVYQGSPAGFVGFLAAAAKVGGFGALLRVLVEAFPTLSGEWAPVVGALAALSVVVGTLFAIVQSDLRRVLAYSGVAHAGFIATGLVAGAAGGAAVWFYLTAYAVQLLAAFAVISLVSGSGGSESPLDAYAGLGERSPFLAGVLTLMMLGMSGLPATSGFVAKFGVFNEAWQAGYGWLVIVGLLASVAAFFFYLRVIVVMYMESPVLAGAPGTMARNPEAVGPVRWVMLVSVALTLLLGLYPAPLLQLLNDVVAG